MPVEDSLWCEGQSTYCSGMMLLTACLALGQCLNYCALEDRPCLSHHLLTESSMNLPPDKARLLRQYDSEKKWDLICDQERFQVKNPPHTYIEKLQRYLDTGITRKKFRRRVHESTKVLQELEISLRTNHIGWVREFLNDDNRGLDVLVEYLSFTQCVLRLHLEGVENGEEGSLDKGKSWSRSTEGLHRISCRALCNTLAESVSPGIKAAKSSQLLSQKDDVHVCIMCLRAVMNYQYGFNLVMSHPQAVNEIALSLNNKNFRTKALVLELLAAVCLVRGGHEIILSAFDHFKRVCKEKHRFERLMDCFRSEDGNIDFMVACMQFINIVVHSVEDMNFRVHLQYEFTKLGLDDLLEKCRHTESDKLSVQIQAYLENMFDVGGLLEDAETKNVALEKVEELEEKLSHVTEKLLVVENETIMKVAELEKQLLQKDKELVAITETFDSATSQVHTLRQMIKEKDTSYQQHCDVEKQLQELEQQGALHLPPQHAKTPSQDVSRVLGVCSSAAAEAPPPAPPLLPPPPPPLPSTSGDSITSRVPPPVAPPLPGTSPCVVLSPGLSAIRIKKPIKTKFRLPVFNWTALKPNQIKGTVFSEIDDERVLKELDLDKFEELFKTKAQGSAMDVSCVKSKVSHKGKNKVTLLDVNRSKNLAITLHKAGKTTEEICRAIQTFDLKALPVDFVECLMRFLPTEAESKLLRQYERERRPLEQLAEEDRFMLHFNKIERLTQRMTIMAFVGNFADNVSMLMPQLNAIIAASVSVKASSKLKRMLEVHVNVYPCAKMPLLMQIILALGNYMNSSKRGSVYGFKLQSLDLLLDTKSTDRTITLLHYIALVVKEKYPELANFFNELHFVEKAATVSLENVLLDVRELGQGMELIRRECGLHDQAVLRTFLQSSEPQLVTLQKDSKMAEEAFSNVVLYFGENPKTTPPSVFFPVFVRFVKSYKEAVEDNEQRKKHEKAVRERQLAQEAKQQDSSAHKKRQQQQELIAELRRRQAKDHRPVYEGKDGTIEDIITVQKLEL
ncbi:formin-like protein 3-like [Scleropages formosus]|uniref:Formin-like protein 3-like n=1 Tax=Scleropages formosus TaxID=113540 RepID=A0A0P7V8G6_SCLFO|nr:formin-like protein 3-like [Scleropages formosus]